MQRCIFIQHMTGKIDQRAFSAADYRLLQESGDRLMSGFHLKNTNLRRILALTLGLLGAALMGKKREDE